MPETRFGDYLSFLQDLGRSGQDHFLEGGQAVNFWAEYFSAKDAGDALSSFMPFTSKDCDVWASHAALQYLKSKKEGGRLVVGNSPADGQVGVFKIGGSPTIMVDIMSNVYGIAQNRMKRLRERTLIINDVCVIDPILLFQSKCHCLLGLDQRGRQDEKHLKMLCLLVPEHLAGLLKEASAGHLTQRALVKELKFLKTILGTSPVRRALKQIGVEASDLIPIGQLQASGLTKVERFAKMEYEIEE